MHHYYITILCLWASPIVLILQVHGSIEEVDEVNFQLFLYVYLHLHSHKQLYVHMSMLIYNAYCQMGTWSFVKTTEAPYAQIGCSRDENVEVDVWEN